jgi:beta-lactam-binding protein with PASTA domain
MIKRAHYTNLASLILVFLGLALAQAAEETKLSVPDLIGKSKKEAVRRLSAIGLNSLILESANEEAKVIDQAPAPGTPIVSGGYCQLFFSQEARQRYLLTGTPTTGAGEAILLQKLPE